jgi:hypothetical protein
MGWDGAGNILKSETAGIDGFSTLSLELWPGSSARSAPRKRNSADSG